jgi:hypothetical protein
MATTTAPESLITVDEAEEVVQAKTGPMSALRVPLMVFLAVTIVAALTLLILVIMSLRGAQTGLEAALPFLDKKPTESLREPGR